MNTLFFLDSKERWWEVQSIFEWIMEEGCTEQAAPCRIEHAGLRAKESALIEEEENLSLCPGKWTARRPLCLKLLAPEHPKPTAFPRWLHSIPLLYNSLKEDEKVSHGTSKPSSLGTCTTSVPLPVSDSGPNQDTAHLLSCPMPEAPCCHSGSQV